MTTVGLAMVLGGTVVMVAVAYGIAWIAANRER